MVILANIFKYPNIIQQIIAISRNFSLIYLSPLQTIFKDSNITSNINLGRPKASVLCNVLC